MNARNFAGVSERAGIGEGSGRAAGRRRGDEEGCTALESAAGASERVVGVGTAETRAGAGDGVERERREAGAPPDRSPLRVLLRHLYFSRER